MPKIRRFVWFFYCFYCSRIFFKKQGKNKDKNLQNFAIKDEILKELEKEFQKNGSGEYQKMIIK